MSSPDIAEALGIGLAVVKLRVHRSRLFMRKHLSEHLESAYEFRARPHRHRWRRVVLS